MIVMTISSINILAIKSIPHRADIKMIDIYSARNTMTNRTDLYSVLNPLTSSLSPSAKSKGDRLASASTLTVNIRNTLIIHLITTICLSWERSKIMNIRDPRTIIVILTSYEIVWATARIAPNMEYFLFLLHPAPSVPYTPTLATARI